MAYIGERNCQKRHEESKKERKKESPLYLSQIVWLWDEELRWTSRRVIQVLALWAPVPSVTAERLLSLDMQTFKRLSIVREASPQLYSMCCSPTPPPVNTTDTLLYYQLTLSRATRWNKYSPWSQFWIPTVKWTWLTVRRIFKMHHSPFENWNDH